MLSTIEIILLLILISVITFGIWNWSNLRGLKNHSSRRTANLDDAKYWELKSKQEFLVAVVTIVTAVIAFLGYNSKKDIESNIKTSMRASIDSVKIGLESELKPMSSKVDTFKSSLSNAEGSIKDAENKIKSYQQKINELNKQSEALKYIASNSKNQADEVLKRISEINKNNVLKQQVYICRVVYDTSNTDQQHFNFQTLTTILGDKLPKFKAKPIVIAISTWPLNANKITINGFNLYTSGGYSTGDVELENDKASVTVMIYEVP